MLTEKQIQDYISKHETYDNHSVICPYCGSENNDPSIYNETTEEYCCDDCGRTFILDASFTWHFSGIPIKEEVKKILSEEQDQ